MRVPLSWLRDYVEIELTPEQLAERLTLLGMEVKGLERWGSEWRNVVVGELLTVERHPRADRLSLTTVRVANDEVLEIVCGATNIAPGQRIPVALPGAVLPGDRRIERTEKMGVVSNGMLCSGDELRLTTDADGILILPATTPIGAGLTELYGDVVLDVDVKPNRGDALSLVGLAREVAAATGAAVQLPRIELVEAGKPTGARLSVSVDEPDLCSRFVGRWVAGVRVGPSPDVVQMRLQAAGMRPVSNVVDASNYVMLELGKPTHTFDAAAVADGRIVVRLARAGERLETLDHVERELTPETLVIADTRGVLGIAGVMGGASSEVTDRTTDVVIESAIFDPVSIRRTGQRYALRSEASLRFEKGQEHRLARLGADRVAQLLAEWAGGTVAPGVVDTDPDEPARVAVAFRPARVNRLLGTELARSEQAELLALVGIETEVAPPNTPIAIARGTRPLDLDAPVDETLLAVVPTWRRDLAIEADVIEEIARVRGYELLPGTTPDGSMPGWRPSPHEVRDAVRDALAGAGLSEVVTHALVAPSWVDLLGWSGDPSGDGFPVVPGDPPAGGEPITVTNPLSVRHSVLRRELVSSLLAVLDTNLRQGRTEVAVFEVGRCYGRAADGTVREWWRLGIALTGRLAPPSWDRPGTTVDIDDAKGLVSLVATRLGFERPVFGAAPPAAPFHPGRDALASALAPAGDPEAGAVVLHGRVAEVHPATIEAFELRTTARVVVVELAIRGLAGGQLRARRSGPVARVPAIERDLAIVVDEAIPVGAVAAAIESAADELLVECRLFDVYRGAPLPEGTKSLAFRLRFQPLDGTLPDDELDRRLERVREALRSTTGARFRE